MEYILQIIKDYIESDQQLAVQIDGEWGVGKTYYVKNTLMPDLEKADYKVIYFSVYGYESLEDIKEQLILQLLAAISNNGRWFKKFKSIKKQINPIIKEINGWKSLSTNIFLDFISESYQRINLDKKFKGLNLVIFIDDLERLSSKIEIQDFLGFVSSEILDNLHCKTVIISNEKEIDEKFKSVKEKIINNTLSFTNSLESIEKEILLKSRNMFIRNNSQWIKKTLQNILLDDKLNFRTLLLSLSNYDVIEHKLQLKNIKEFDVETKLNVQKTLFLNVFVVTNEYRKGNVNFKNVYQISALSGADSTFINSEIDDGDIRKLIVEKYHKKDNEFDRLIMYDKSINEFILNGYLEDSSYLLRWKKKFIFVEEEDSLKKVSQYEELTDKEIAATQNNLIVDVESRKITVVHDLISVYMYFVFFSENDLLYSDNIQNFREIIKDNILISFKEGMDSFDRRLLNHPASLNGIYSKEIVDILYEANIIQQDEKLLRLVEAIFQNDYAATQEILGSGLRNINIFDIINKQKLVEIYIVNKSSRAHYLRDFIQRKLMNVSDINYDERMILDIQEMIGNINTQIKNKALEKIDVFKIKQLTRSLDELLNRLEFK